MEDALLFRTSRRASYAGSDSTEATLEIQEGLPEYVGHKLAMLLTGENVVRVATHVSSYSQRNSYVRSFAYGTGPALGVLLDRFSPGWRVAVREKRDMSGLLAHAIKFSAPRNLERVSRARAGAYGFASVDSSERAREQSRVAMMADYRARLFDGPIITFRQARDSLSWGFDPNAVIAFDLRSVIYPFGTFTAPWGSLNVESNGVLVRNDLSVIQVGSSGGSPAPNDRRWSGTGWAADAERRVGIRSRSGQAWQCACGTGCALGGSR